MVSSPSSPASRSRFSALLGAAMLVVGLAGTTACGSSSRPTAEVGAAREADPTTTLAAPTTVAPATTTTLRPLGAHESLVAVVRPEVTRLVTFAAPNGAEVEAELPLINPWYFGGELALLVTGGREVDPWVQVMLPGRPNGTIAWIKAADVTFRSTTVHLTVGVGERMLRAYDGDTMLLETAVVVGRSSTPTPLGRFYVNAHIPQANAGGAYGPVILSVSSFSEALATFDGGLPEIGIHGTNQPSLVGQAVSNGCIRMPNDAIIRLAELVPVGAPVEFVA